MNNKKITQFHSCFIVDVEIDESAAVVRLLDSNRIKYTYKLDSPEKKNEFKKWLTTVFLIGRSQTPSVFRYHEENDPPDTDIVIDKFIRNIQKQCVLNESEANTP